MIIFRIVLFAVLFVNVFGWFSPTETNANRRYFSGQLVFREEFNTLNKDLWRPQIDFIGGGGDEFNIYDKHDENSYVKNGVLFIKPTLTGDRYGEDFRTNGSYLKLDGCTADPNDQSCYGNYGHNRCCERYGWPGDPLPPIISARLRTQGSFSFRYGRVEIRAKMPSADWTWPALWFLPDPEDGIKHYGKWPTSGEIDMAELKGNLNLRLCETGLNLGAEHYTCNLHYGPHGGRTGGDKAHGSYNTQGGQGYDKEFHRYTLIWTKEYMRFLVDGREIRKIQPPSGGMWEFGGFAPEYQNPFNENNTDNFRMAPFDRKFYIILNVATGGKGFQGSICDNYPNPWDFTDFYSPQRLIDFWGNRTNWLPSWEGDRPAMQVDYVRIYAI